MGALCCLYRAGLCTAQPVGIPYFTPCYYLFACTLLCWCTTLYYYITPVFIEFHVSKLCRAQPFRNATLHPPFIEVLFFVVIGDTFFTGCAYKVIIAVMIP